jgi:hypothetical protein
MLIASFPLHPHPQLQHAQRENKVGKITPARCMVFEDSDRYKRRAPSPVWNRNQALPKEEVQVERVVYRAREADSRSFTAFARRQQLGEPALKSPDSAQASP